MTLRTRPPEFILMLTRNDSTVSNARELARGISNPKLNIVGFKDVGGLNKPALAELATIIRDKGKKVALEVVSPDQSAEMRSVEMACALKVDLLLGGTRANEVANVIRGSELKYFPFPGVVVDHPSRLTGTVSEITAHAQELASVDGVCGLDLLAYRHSGNVTQLMTSVVGAAGIPVVIAGSIDSSNRIAAVVSSRAWGFTVGAAAIDGLFSPARPNLNHQIEAIIRARDEAVNEVRGISK